LRSTRPHAYGGALTAHLFADPQVPEAFHQARTNAQSLDKLLRVRHLQSFSAARNAAISAASAAW
jgi:hypothetical protein